MRIMANEPYIPWEKDPIGGVSSGDMRGWGSTRLQARLGRGGRTATKLRRSANTWGKGWHRPSTWANRDRMRGRRSGVLARPAIMPRHTKIKVSDRRHMAARQWEGAVETASAQRKGMDEGAASFRGMNAGVKGKGGGPAMRMRHAASRTPECRGVRAGEGPKGEEQGDMMTFARGMY